MISHSAKLEVCAASVALFDGITVVIWDVFNFWIGWFHCLCGLLLEELQVELLLLMAIYEVAGV